MEEENEYKTAATVPLRKSDLTILSASNLFTLCRIHEEARGEMASSMSSV
jgi:hypothetical protein